MANPFEGSPAAVFVGRQSELLAHRKTQKQIALEAGFASGNLISMIKSGATKIPLDRVPKLAQALEADPGFLMRLALEQAIGKTGSVAVLEAFGTPTTVNERAWLDEIRDASGHTDPKLTARSRTTLRAIFGK